MKKWCIYKITNLINGKVYIGKHKYSNINDGYFGSGKILKYAIEKYGKDNFIKEICKDNIGCETAVDFYETLFIKKENCIIPNGYNLTLGGEGGDTFTNRSEESKELTRSRMSESRTGEKNPFYGKTHSDEIKAHLKECAIKNSDKTRQRQTGKTNSFYGKQHTDELKKNFSEKYKGNGNPFYGKHHTPETIAKMKETKRLKRLTSCLNSRSLF